VSASGMTDEEFSRAELAAAFREAAAVPRSFDEFFHVFQTRLWRDAEFTTQDQFVRFLSGVMNMWDQPRVEAANAAFGRFLDGRRYFEELEPFTSGPTGDRLCALEDWLGYERLVEDCN